MPRMLAQCALVITRLFTTRLGYNVADLVHNILATRGDIVDTEHRVIKRADCTLNDENDRQWQSES